MCSFLFSTNSISNIEEVNRIQKLRGPDGTSILKLNSYTFLHNLLSITGNKCVQPIRDGNKILLFNGEIYNYKDVNPLANCDTDIILKLYSKHGLEYGKLLDGEFAICIVDLDTNEIILTSDPFSTKPMWYSTQNGFHVATYKSALEGLGCTNIKRILPNLSVKFNLSTFNLIDTSTTYNFDLTQHKNSCDDWIIAFENSITKRANTNKGIFLGVSGGYDSGAILCELSKQNIDCKAFSIVNNEDSFIIEKRKKLYPSLDIINFDSVSISNLESEMKIIVENFQYPPEYKLYRHSLYDDQSTLGLMHICKLASPNKIYLSGQGADEIMSDYGMFGNSIFEHSTIGGKFPEDLTTVFPWKNFYLGAQQCYLSKEENISGAYGREGRYPFLDKFVVQEFLWLSSTIKNKRYKAPLYEYFSRNNYPFVMNEKNGFNPFYKP